MTPEEEYQYWIEKFYTGRLLIPGWNDHIKTALAGYAGDERQTIEQEMRSLGDKICMEWAKDNSIRKIDNNDLMKFGDRIKAAKKKDIATLRAEIQAIDQLVDERLA